MRRTELLQPWNVGTLGSNLKQSIHLVRKTNVNKSLKVLQIKILEIKQTNLDWTTMKLRLMQLKGFLDCLNFQEFDISKTLWLTVCVSENGDSVNRATGLKMLLNFFRGASIINLQFNSNISMSINLAVAFPAQDVATKSLAVEQLRGFRRILLV